MVEGGLSFREIARRTGCSHQTIMKLVERNKMTGSVSDNALNASELRHVSRTTTYKDNHKRHIEVMY